MPSNRYGVKVALSNGAALYREIDAPDFMNAVAEIVLLANAVGGEPFGLELVEQPEK